VSVRLRIWLAWALLVGSVIGWPLSALTLARGEPPFVLGLSWLAITLTALDILSTQDVRQQHEDDER
jgi:hypothetical protein